MTSFMAYDRDILIIDRAIYCFFDSLVGILLQVDHVTLWIQGVAMDQNTPGSEYSLTYRS